MAQTDRRTLLARLAAGGLVAGAGALAGCAPGGRDIADGRPEREGGIGGTGIVGTLTEFGSVVVNGQRVALGPETEVRDGFGRLGAEALRLGHSLTVEATGPDDALLARRIRITHAVVGPLTGLESGDLRVAGVPVRPVPGLALPTAPGEGSGIGGTGIRLAVSGLWDGTTVVASRLDVVPPAPVALGGARPDALSGTLRLGPDGPALQGVRLTGIGSGADLDGQFVTVIGRARERGFAVATLETGRFLGGIGPLSRLSVEGYLEPVPEAPGFAISGLGHSFDAGARPGAMAGGRALFVGPYDGKFAVARALALPEAPEPRTRALAPGLDLARVPGAVSTR